MTGSLQSDVAVEFRHDEARQRTVLTRRKAGGLCHLGKAYWSDPVLSLQLVNPTAGLFSNDALRVSVDVQDGAQVALTSPSASRFHTMPTGRAELTQAFTIGRRAWLDYWPEIVIPQRDSDVRQRTRIQLAADSSMVFLDTLAPGRIAHGENQQFRRLDTSLEIRRDDELLVKERCVLCPAEGRWPLSVPGWDTCYYGAIWIAGPAATAGIEIAASAIESPAEDYFGGCSQLNENLAVIRLVTRTSLILRRLTTQLRKDLQPAIPLLNTNFRKL